MTLRTRLRVGFVAIFIAVLAAGVVAVTSQRAQLYDQIDDRLSSTSLPPAARARPLGGAQEFRPPATNPQGENSSISDIYVSVVVDDGEQRPIVIGQLLDDVPDIGFLVESPPNEMQFYTVDGVDGISTFRVLYQPGAGPVFNSAIAVPIDDVQESVRNLAVTFAAMAGVLLLLLIAVASWVRRLGLQPLSSMTDLAEAVASGESARRAEIANNTTEAGRLGQALNLMLDHRDRTETRLRQFVSDASHELRTPLTSIQGYVDLYLAGGFREDGELDDAMRRVRFETRRMNRLVGDLLVLAKSDEQRPLNLETVRLDTMLYDVVALAQAAHPDSSMAVSAPAPITVRADRYRLHQAIAALVDNAVQHTPAESSIRVSAALTDKGVEIAVADDGHGLTAGEAELIFDRFSRTDRSRARNSGGSGLGLAITKSIVTAHGGEIDVASEPGSGATFRITLPVDPAPVDRIAQRPHDAPDPLPQHISDAARNPGSTV